jgi:MFS family permease
MSWGFALLAGGFFSAGSIGMVFAITAGMVTALVALRSWAVRLVIFVTMVTCLLFLFFFGRCSFAAELRDDARIVEPDGVNLKQRYIEWQAFLNLLERRWMTGTGAGCVNDYRSAFYYRLPKLNTIKAFDQNGYLATAAETGIAGLVCFCWVLVHYGKQGLYALKKRFNRQGSMAWRIAVANIAGFAAACTANLFSSVQYNGVLIVFVLVLVLIERSERVFDDF